MEASKMDLGTPIAEGNTAKIYVHDQKIIKLFDDRFLMDEAIREANKQKLVHLYGLPVPNVFEVTEIGGRAAIVMEYISGPTLGELAFNDPNRMEDILNQSIGVQRKIHEITPIGLEPMKEKLARQINSVQDIDRNHRMYLLDMLESMPYESKLCHGDFHLYNLIKSDKGLTIIDWVDCSAGDIRADVYRTYLLYSGVSIEIAELYLNLFCEQSGLTQSEIFEWAPLIAAAKLSENVRSENRERLLEIVYSK